MKLNFGRSPYGINISNVNIGGRPSGPLLDISVGIYSGRARQSAPSLSTSKIFCLLTTHPAETEKFLSDQSSIMTYINNTALGAGGKRSASKEDIKSAAPFANGAGRGQPASAVYCQVDSLGARYGQRWVRGPNGYVYHKNFQLKLRAHSRHMFLFVGLYNSLYDKTFGTMMSSMFAMDTLSVAPAMSAAQSNILLFTNTSMSDIYMGDAYQNSQGDWYKTGLPPGATGARLTAQEVPNLKVTYSSAWNKQLFKQLLSTVEEKINFEKKNYDPQQVMKIYQSNSRNYFSPLYGTKTALVGGRTGTEGFPILFAFNKDQFFKDRGSLAHVLRNRTALASSFTLKSAKLYRKRKLTKDVYNPLTIRGISLDFEQGETVVTRELDVVSLMPSPLTMFMSAVDTEGPNLSAGIYAYGVELVFQDMTFEKIKGVLNAPPYNLLSIESQLRALYLKSQQLNNYDGNTRRITPNFEGVLDRTPKGDKIWVNAIYAYLSALNLFCKSIEAEFNTTPELLATNIYSFTNPFDNGPAGIYRLIEIIGSLTSQIKQLIGTDTFLSTIPDDGKGTRVSKMDDFPRFVRIKHYFDARFDPRDYRDDGFDYLSSTIENKSTDSYTPLRVISYNRLNDILGTLPESYSLGSLTNGVSLSPRYFSMDGKATAVNSTLPDSFKNNSVVATTLLAASQCAAPEKNYAQFSTIVDQSETGLPSWEIRCIRNNLRLLALESCTVRIDEDDIKPREYYKDKGKASNETEDASIKMSMASPFITKGDRDIGLIDFLYNMQNNDPNQEYLDEISKISNHILYYLTQTDYFDKVSDMKDIPVKNITDINVFKSKESTVATLESRLLEESQKAAGEPQDLMRQMLLGQSPFSYKFAPQHMEYLRRLKGAVTAIDIVEFYLKYGEVRNVQYCAGFSRIGGELQLSDPVWVNLTRSTLENFSATGRSLFCRLIKPSTAFSDYKGLDASAYDNYFILGSEAPMATRPYPVANLGARGLNVSIMSGINKQQFSSNRENNLFMFSTIPGSQIDYEANTLSPYRQWARRGASTRKRLRNSGRSQVELSHTPMQSRSTTDDDSGGSGGPTGNY